MAYNRSFLHFSFVLAFALSNAVASANQILATRDRSVALPMDTVVSEYGSFVLDSTAGVGFISSVIPSSLISFSARSAKVLSTVQFGEMACAPSMVEVGGERLIALPTSTGLEGAYASSVSIINATKADQLERIALVALPSDARLRPDTRALLTKDGRFGVIASSSNDACLFSFNVQTGQVVSRLLLYGEPYGIALEDNTVGRTVVVANTKLNNLFISKLNEQGQLNPVGAFIPSDGHFEYPNEPEFSIDGRNVYIAASKGDRLYAIDADSCMLQASVSVSAPQRVTVARGADGTEIIGVTRLRRASDGRPGGATILTNSDGRLIIRAEFAPPNEFQFSSANNVVFSSDASFAFIGSATGILFSFDTRTGRLITYKVLGGELRRLMLSQPPRTLLAVRSTLTKDDIAVVDVDRLIEGKPKTQELPRLKPEIKRVSNDGTYLHLLIEGSRFSTGSLVEFVKEGKVVFQQSAVRITENQLTVVVPTKKFKEIGKCDIRVVTGASMATDSATIEPLTLLLSKTVEPIQKTSATVQKTLVTEGSSPLATVVSAVRSESDANSTRVFIDADGETKIQSFRLLDPFRIVIDVVAVRNALGNRTINVDGALIQRIRTGCPKPGIVRVVLDAKSNVHYEITRKGGSIEVAVSEPKSADMNRNTSVR